MTDLITAEDAKKLLDGSTPGPWEWTTGRFSNNPHLSPNILLLAFDGGGPDGVDPNDAANARLIAAAPDLARTVIALHAQLADAQAAQAMVVERAARTVRALHEKLCTAGHPTLLLGQVTTQTLALEAAIRDLAPIDGLALVRELRAERDAARQLFVNACAPLAVSPDIQDVVAAVEEWVNKRGGEETADQIAVMAIQAYQRATEAERDRLAAANAVLEAKVAGLRAAFRVNMLRFGPPGTSHEEIDAAIDAALATQEAGT